MWSTSQGQTLVFHRWQMLHSVLSLLKAVPRHGGGGWQGKVIGSVSHLGNPSLGLLSRASSSLYQGREGTAHSAIYLLIDIHSDRAGLSLHFLIN